MEPTIKQISTAFKSALLQMVEAGVPASRGMDLIMTYVLGKSTGVDINSKAMGTLYHWQLVNPIRENVDTFEKEGLYIRYKLQPGTYSFTVYTDKHNYTITLPYTLGPFYDYSSTTIH